VKRIIALGIVCAACGLFTSPASAGLSASGVLSATPDGSNWDYTIELTDTGTTSIGTFWFSWIPGQGYLPTLPSDFTEPTGWAAHLTDGPPPPAGSDGYSIQFVASSNLLEPGQTATFGFTSSDSPTTLAGDSAIHSPTPILTSFIYSGAPFSDSGFQFVVTPAGASVPEPSTLALGIMGLATVAAAMRLRRKSAK
jgi:hypothetical protein